MEITEVKVSLRDEDRLKAYVSVTFDNCFVVKNIRIVKSDTRLLLSMPSKKLNNGEYRDIAHPISHRFREILESKIMDQYKSEVEKASSDAQEGEGDQAYTS